MDKKTARLTVLISPSRKDAFEKLCYAQDSTPSQVLRRLIREYVDSHAPPARADARKASR
jgi:hypothetical protein